MSFTAFLLISASIILHSTWNFLCKSSGKPSYAFFALFSTSLFLTMLPFGICSGLLTSIPWDIWKFAICGAVSGSIGNIGLRFAYKYSDISIAYPMARAIPVFLTMFLTMLFGWGAPLTAAATAGMIVIFAGCVIMAFSNNVKDKTWREKLSFLKKGLPGIMIAAVGTTLYTIVDSYGVRGIMEFAPDRNKLLLAGTYSCIRESSVVVLMWGCVGLCSLRKKEPGALSSLLRSYHSYLAGAMAALAYVLILLAMNYVTNVSFVQAFRQLSLPIGMLMGYFLLKEKVTLNRWIALILIMTGLILCIL